MTKRRRSSNSCERRWWFCRRVNRAASRGLRTATPRPAKSARESGASSPSRTTTPIWYAACPLWQNFKSAPQFADGHGAQVERLFVLRVNSLADAGLGTGANELGRDVCVEQKAAHAMSTGRSVVGWRLKSTSSARPLTASNTSRRLLPRAGADTSAGMWTASSSKLAA